MSFLLSRFYRTLRCVNMGLAKTLEYILILVMALLVIDVLWGVFSRFVLGAQSAWTEEVARFLLVWVALFGAALAFRQKQHLGVDVFTQLLHAEAQRGARILVHIIVVVFALLIFVLGGFKLVQNSILMQQQMISVPVSKAVFYSALPLSGMLIILFSIESLTDTLGEQAEN